MSVLADVFVFLSISALALAGVAFLGVWVTSLFDRWNKP